MVDGKRPSPLDAANLFINQYFPNCQAALLAGSVVRGEATDTSDLDIVIFDQNLRSSYRESFIQFGWYIECFVHNFSSYKEYFESDCKRAKPAMPKMVSEGIILKHDDRLKEIKKEAKDLLEKGPEEWSAESIKVKRYFLTDALDDFKGCINREEGILIANTLAEATSEFVLRTNRKWTGSSKWVLRALKNYDEDFAMSFINAFDTYYKENNKELIIRIVEEVLEPFGGSLFAGFSMGKHK
ncbi:nucleotidyltransferase domain-containing protein [Bacillus niameyensis]|uniref:nucleotidyltransferase domain-containing protein n=1 Tax=Bacillus niameyensis TaxID=1522308 RepID=UPI0007841B1C|nr:nucleotidyltransferase domain-containing protein [Bacillus niameyensis]